jgi:hypothetical protein
VHADDLGASRGVTDGIVRCIDAGPVESTSIIANGPAFDYAVEALRERPHVQVSVHLNLVEGRPLRPASELDLLVDGDGFFRHQLLSLWLTQVRATAATRARLEAQVRAELTAQVERVREAVGRDVRVRLDSHQHLHHIPFVFDIVTGLGQGVSGGQIRLMREPFFVDVKGWRRHTISGVGKHLLLKSLAARHGGGATDHGLAADDWVVGALLTGRMSPTGVEAALRRIQAVSGADASVELLFHPGGAVAGEEWIWAPHPAFRAYYFSPWRQFESVRLRSPEMAACLERWRKGHDGRDAADWKHQT